MSDWKNLMDIDFDTEPHFDKANSLERSCRNCSKKRMTLNPMEKCKHEFNLEKDNAGNITLKEELRGYAFEELFGDHYVALLSVSICTLILGSSLEWNVLWHLRVRV